MIYDTEQGIHHRFTHCSSDAIKQKPIQKHVLPNPNPNPNRNSNSNPQSNPNPTYSNCHSNPYPSPNPTIALP